MPFTTRRPSDRIPVSRETGGASISRCNIRHVRGRDFDLVIDTGMGLLPLKDWVRLVSDRPLKAICTQCHFDHMGACTNLTAALATGPRRPSLPLRRRMRSSIPATGRGSRS